MRWLVALAVVLATPVGVASLARAEARIVGDHIEVTPRIAFATDRPILRAESETALADVAALLGAHPEIERLRVEHYTDDRGNAERVRLLGEQRARAVSDWLAVHHIDVLRLESVAISACRGTAGCDRSLARQTVLRIVALTGPQRARLDRLRQRRALFDALGSAAVRCGGARTFDVDDRIAVALTTGCFFGAGTSTVRPEALPLLAIVGREAAAHRARRYTVEVEAAEGAARPWPTASAQAAAIAQSLVANGVSVERITASARAANREEIYDGPSHLAPGQALVVFALDPDVAELR